MTRLFGMMALVCLLAVQIAGCAGTKISSKRLCEGSGGMYVAGGCQPGKAMKAIEMCQAQAGNYNAGDDTCEIGGERSK